jgi:lysophospholipid acyltransferase (LPLAT)-like uncharacterized protein
MLKDLLRRPWLQASLAWLVSRYLDFALRTTRWTLHGEAHIAPYLNPQRPVIVAFWHERLPLMSELWLTARRANGGEGRVFVLVSRHRDGRFIGEVVRHFAMDVVYGSTARRGQERGGAAGLRSMLAMLEAGDYVAITPDGPRGPRRVAAAGVAQLAALSGVPVLPCAGKTKRRWTLPTWDRMVLPLPFGRGVLVCGETFTVPRDGAEDAVQRIAEAITAATDEADRLCR